MKKAAKVLEGKHDFTSFRSTECQAKSPVKTINSLKIIRKSSEIEIWIKAKSFLHNQVRIIAGTLMMVGKAKWKKKDVENALKAKKRGAAGQTAPAYGLFLFSVKY
jgi:tRNA pseudouridine38-40 synthase